jgi:hypothetical protein
MHARIAVFVSLVGLGLAPACDLDDDLSREEQLDRQLERAEAATAKYRDVAAALADGFVSTVNCVSHPEHGTMGIHFVHEGRLADPAVTIEEPEVLVYLPSGRELRLVALEYVQVFLIDGAPYLGCGVENQSCPPRDPPPASPLYEGVAWNGPMAGHERGMPWHYDLHVWIWALNPAGVFAQYNPTISCD